MIPSWSEHLNDAGVVDLFHPSSDPRSLAINRILNEAVVAWIAGDINEATRLVKIADKYIDSPKRLFEEDINCV